MGYNQSCLCLRLSSHDLNKINQFTKTKQIIPPTPKKKKKVHNDNTTPNFPLPPNLEVEITVKQNKTFATLKIFIFSVCQDSTTTKSSGGGKEQTANHLSLWVM